MKYLKKIVSLLLVFTMIFIPFNASLKVQAASQKSKALKAYKTMLSKKTIKWGIGSYKVPVSTKNCKFAIAYVDKDSVPELIVQNNMDVPHMAGYGMIYTYQKGKVKAIENINIDAKFSYYKKKGVFVDSYVSGGTSYSYYKLSKGKATKKLMQGTTLIDGKKHYYQMPKDKNKPSKEISKKKFNKELKKLIGKTKKTTVKFYKNTATNRKKRIK